MDKRLMQRQTPRQARLRGMLGLCLHRRLRGMTLKLRETGTFHGPVFACRARVLQGREQSQLCS
jgi:hypothetical protein